MRAARAEVEGGFAIQRPSRSREESEHYDVVYLLRARYAECAVLVVYTRRGDIWEGLGLG